MRNISAWEVAIKIVDAVYADLILYSREVDSKESKRVRRQIEKILRIRHRMEKFYPDLEEFQTKSWEHERSRGLFK